ncbi:MAG: hypothetical protein WAO52_04015 [Prolixibacteraceae bacterium]
MKKSIYKLGFIFCLILFSLNSFSQNSQDSIKSRIETIDGNEYIGFILERSAEKIRVKTDKLGEITIPAGEVKRISEVTVSQAKDGTYWLDNPQATRYFWAPNGYNLKKGEGYYQNVWVFFNQAVYGITDHFSAGIGTMPLFLLGTSEFPIWLTLKYSVPVVKDKINLGAGVLAGTVTGENGYAGIFYGIGTFGSKDKNLNIGLGWGFVEGEISSTPLVNIGGLIRTGKNGYMITENYLIINSGEMVCFSMFGGRRIIRNFGIDFGLGIPWGAGVESFVAIPWLGFTVPFGKK